MSAHPAFDRLAKKLREAREKCAKAALTRLPVEDYHFFCGCHDAFEEAIELTQEAQKTWLSGDDEDGQES